MAQPPWVHLYIATQRVVSSTRSSVEKNLKYSRRTGASSTHRHDGDLEGLRANPCHPAIRRHSHFGGAGKLFPATLTLGVPATPRPGLSFREAMPASRTRSRRCAAPAGAPLTRASRRLLAATRRVPPALLRGLLAASGQKIGSSFMAGPGIGTTCHRADTGPAAIAIPCGTPSALALRRNGTGPVYPDRGWAHPRYPRADHPRRTSLSGAPRVMRLQLILDQHAIGKQASGRNVCEQINFDAISIQQECSSRVFPMTSSLQIRPVGNAIAV